MEAVGASLALRARGVTKSFLGTRALDDVDFDVARGEVHALQVAEGPPGACRSGVARSATRA